MASTSSLAFKHWSRIITRWPKDLVRPENVSFQTRMRQRLDRHLGKAPSVTKAKAKDVAATTIPSVQWNEVKEAQQTSVLYALLENRFASGYPMPKSLRNPASSPTYYDDLVREMQEAPSRSWFGGLKKRIMGSLRLK